MTASVVLPTYNERDTICTVIQGLYTHLESPEIVVVDDNSPDNTAQHVQENYSEVRVHVRENKSGLASAVVDGFRLAEGDAYLVMDADGQHPPSDTQNLVAALSEGADLAVGSRRVDQGENNAQWGLKRYVLSYGASFLAYLAVPPARQFNDPISGFFAVDSSVVDPVIDRLDPDGYKILLEVLARCPIRTVAEVPMSFQARDDGDSNLTWQEEMQYLKHALRLGYSYRRTPTVEEISIPEETYE